MKRALAERAKQHADEQQQQQRTEARKVQRVLPSSPRSSSGGTKKRQRPASPSDHSNSEEDEDRNADAFYLKHQNKQLASELYSLKREISLLQEERSVRRKECHRIGHVLSAMEGIFRTAETYLLANSAPPAPSTLTQLQQDCVSNRINHFVSPPSTGKGADVETIQNMTDALSRIIQSPLPQPPPTTTTTTTTSTQQDSAEEPPCDLSSLLSTKDTHQPMASFAKRWFYYHKHILEILAAVNHNNNNNNNSMPTTLLESVSLTKQISDLEHTKDELTSQVHEIAKSRDAAMDSERKVRRGLYRLASGRWKIAEVLKAIDNDKSSLDELSDLPDTPFSGEVGSSNTVVASTEDNANTNDAETNDTTVSSAEVAQVKKQLQDMEQIAESRDKRISELLEEREKLNLQVNSILASSHANSEKKVVSEDDIRCSPFYLECMSKLVAAQAAEKKLKMQLTLVNERWAQSKGDILLATKTIADIEEKHARRWKELCSTNHNHGETTLENKVPNGGSQQQQQQQQQSQQQTNLIDAKKIVELEHKLNHALENVRQAENIRASLTEANRINETLQSKLEELKAKNSALVANKATARASSLDSSSHSSSHKSSSRESSSGSSSHLSHEKLQRDYRKLKKELSAALQSKEGAKSKQERAEKERDALMKTNVRLVKQSSEKDDMNAKSLSTILHLKHLSEELEKEKEILSKRLKAAEQMALAARLAANAKERVEEEFQREKEVAFEDLKQSNEKILSLEADKEIIQSQLEQMKTQMSLTEKEVNKIHVRCDELVTESRTREKEKQTLVESCAVAKKEAIEAKRKALSSSSSSSAQRGKGSTQFTAEQLTIQVNNLKSRLACPVCNHRDKQVILVRCRHMFCRQCVDKNIKNRSRKCPACAQRFDMKDVGDVWL